MKQALTIGLLVSSTALWAGDNDTVALPDVTVYSPRVALQEPTATFAMPVSALKFEPLVDVQGRNLAEGQSDIAIRGGTFENTGFKLGASNLYDPQTGHYLAEIPVAPSMLSAPEVLTGADNALRSWNATTGTVAYGWRTIHPGGRVTVSAGDYDSRRGELYEGWVSDFNLGGLRFAADAAVATSRSDGSQPFGEHAFDRVNGRFQLKGKQSQTDLFYGYQAKTVAWPNLYTPYTNIFEVDALQTVLINLNHRQELGNGDFIEAGAYFRRNKDHYIFNRKDPGAFNSAFPFGPSFHTSWVGGAGFEGRFTQGEIHWHVDATGVTEKIKSTSLIWGPHQARDHVKVAVAPEREWPLADGRVINAKAGITFDDTNRDGSAYSPVASLTLDRLAPQVGVQSAYVSYARTTQTPTYTALDSRSTAGLFRGNPHLGREVADTIEAGVRGGGQGWTASAAVFYRKDDNLVDWTYATSVPNARSANAVDLDNVGFEGVLRYTSKPVDLVLGYTALSKSADYGNAAVDASFYALNYAKQRVTAAIVWRLGYGVELRADNEIRLQQKDSLRKNGDRAFLTSAGLYYAPAIVKGFRLGAEVENLWNDTFQEVPAVPAAKTQYSLGLTYTW